MENMPYWDYLTSIRGRHWCARHTNPSNTIADKNNIMIQ